MLGNEFNLENLLYIWPRFLCGLRKFWMKITDLSHYMVFFQSDQTQNSEKPALWLLWCYYPNLFNI